MKIFYKNLNFDNKQWKQDKPIHEQYDVVVNDG